jgi:hypothetical protein
MIRSVIVAVCIAGASGASAVSAIAIRFAKAAVPREEHSIERSVRAPRSAARIRAQRGARREEPSSNARALSAREPARNAARAAKSIELELVRQWV